MRKTKEDREKLKFLKIAIGTAKEDIKNIKLQLMRMKAERAEIKAKYVKAVV